MLQCGWTLRHYAKWKKTDIQGYRIYKFHLCEISRIDNFIENGDKINQWLGRRETQEWLIRGMGIFWSDENVLEFDSDDGCTTLWLY